MKTLLKVVLIMVFGGIINGGCSSSQNQQTPEPPRAEIKPHELTSHGEKRIDNYYWLREKENPEVISYIEAENKYLQEVMAPTENLQKTLFAEMKNRIKKDDSSVPYLYNGFWYYTRFEAGSEYAIYCRRADGSETEEVTVNGNSLASKDGYFSITGVEISANSKYLVFGIDTEGRRFYTLKIKDLQSGKILPEVIANVTGESAWAADSKTLFYTRQDPETLRSYQVWRHELGTDSSQDVMVFEETDDTFDVSISQTKSEKYLVITSSQTLSTEIRILESDNPFGPWRIFQERQRDHEYHLEHQDDRFVILTNHEAKNFRLMECPLTKTDLDSWTEVIPHRDHVYLENFEVFNNWLVLEERFDGLTHLMISPNDGSEPQSMQFSDPTWTVWLSTNVNMDSNVLRFGYSSLTTPNSIFDFDMINGEKTQLKQTEVLGDFDSENYESEYLQVPARDGILVPVSLVYRKGLKKDGKNPLLLYAYGSYGYSMDASFSSNQLSLLDRGFVYAIAHIRGGEEKGRTWYEDGKLLKKKNTFTDFIDCGQYLTNQQYTSSDRLFAMGGSAGGLLMGAIMNMSAETWRGIVAHVPWVDVVTTMEDDSIPLTTSEYDEWGNPADEEYYRYMLSYSPYDNVTEMDYPATLVTSGLHDSQVQYWEPTKWVARLRAHKTDNNPLFLKTNMAAGHGGASGRFRRLEETALSYAFMLDLLGIKE
ncbi:MAG: S9 family peptidase [bacterium]|nr:S9 family peptidase [bacterium]